MKVLVIGGSGFIGSRLIELLVTAHHDVTNLDLRSSEQFNSLTTIGDVRIRENVESAARGCEAIVNLAAEHRDDVRPIELYETVNVYGAQVVAEVATALDVNRIVFTSSVAVYGLDKVGPTEESPTDPFNEYSRTKLAAEGILRDWAQRSADRSLSIVRPSVVFGEGNRGNVDTLIRAIAARRFVMTGRGTNRKSMSYVGNVSAFLASRLESDPGVFIFNYADTPDLTSRQIVDTVADALAIPLRVPFALPMRVGLFAGWIFDLISRITGRSMPISAIRVRKFCAETSVDTARLRASGFRAPYELREALHRTIKTDFPRSPGD